MSEIVGYPLQWPHGVARTSKPKSSRFNTGFVASRQGLLDQVRLLGGKYVVISSNLPLRQDGLPYANQAEPQDKGVAVYFLLNGESMVFPCDCWNKVTDNIHAIAKTIEYMRGISRNGVADAQKRAFQGFTALPAPDAWWSILGVKPDASEDEINTAYRSRSKIHHPDAGGNIKEWNKLQKAHDEAMKLRGGNDQDTD